MQTENRPDTESADQALGKADSFLRRRRRPMPQTTTDDDVPVLTDIVPEQTSTGKIEPRSAPPLATGMDDFSGLSGVPHHELDEHDPLLQVTDSELLEEIVAARLADALAAQSHAMAARMEEWVKQNLPTIVSQELNGARTRIVLRSFREIRALLHGEAADKT